MHLERSMLDFVCESGGGWVVLGLRGRVAVGVVASVVVPGAEVVLVGVVPDEGPGMG